MGKYSHLPVGLELYSVREDFEKDPEKTLKKLSTMGYNGVEFFGKEFRLFPAERIRDALAVNGLECYGYLTGWDDMQLDSYEAVLEYNRVLGNKRIAIGAAPASMLNNRGDLKRVIDHLNVMHGIAKKSDFLFGYHNHHTDFVMVDGVTAWDRIFENTPEDFLMVLDTGNALEGGARSIPILRKFPNRSPWIHVKPYKTGNQGHLTMIGEDSFDWPELIEACVETGGAKVLTIEYGQRQQYTPFFGAEICLKRLKIELEKE
jgi:sugar phosphate isomerase/epimerase